MIEALARRPVVTAPPDEDVRAVARKMRDGHVGCVVVVEGRRPVGIVTDRDLALRVLAEGDPPDTPIAAVMSVDPTTVSLGSDVEVVLRSLRLSGTRRVPIVDEEGALVGLVSQDDLLALLARELGALAEGLERAVDAPELR